ncbi:diuretic hormone class 2 [Condylostylus longicornis]|uniref:diuretic hormone class 2 n=1 Tax=Condylostylus longicornis TaxID=2530218 RepID=UPI00244E0515|nr:diuretic hormone class 2 [Condylostylus longicornis]
MMPTKLMCTVVAFAGFCLLLLATTDAAPMPRYYPNTLYNDIDQYNEGSAEQIMRLIERFGQTIMRARNDLENSKRNIDFGLARGYSGTQEAKHRMGMAAASFPGGPGRRRRSESEA